MPPRMPPDAWHWLVNPSPDTGAPCMAEKAQKETVARSRYKACGKAQRTVSSITLSPGCLCLSYRMTGIRGHCRHAPTCALGPTGQASSLFSPTMRWLRSAGSLRNRGNQIPFLCRPGIGPKRSISSGKGDPLMGIGQHCR